MVPTMPQEEVEPLIHPVFHKESVEKWSTARVQAWVQRKSLPNRYYYRFGDLWDRTKPARGKWGEKETAVFMARMEEFKARGIPIGKKWGVFSKSLPGRVGYICSNKLRSLIKAGTLNPEDYNYAREEGGKTKMGLAFQYTTLPSTSFRALVDDDCLDPKWETPEIKALEAAVDSWVYTYHKDLYIRHSSSSRASRTSVPSSSKPSKPSKSKSSSKPKPKKSKRKKTSESSSPASSSSLAGFTSSLASTSNKFRKRKHLATALAELEAYYASSRKRIKGLTGVLRNPLASSPFFPRPPSPTLPSPSTLSPAELEKEYAAIAKRTFVQRRNRGPLEMVRDAQKAVRKRVKAFAAMQTAMAKPPKAESRARKDGKGGVQNTLHGFIKGIKSTPTSLPLRKKTGGRPRTKSATSSDSDVSGGGDGGGGGGHKMTIMPNKTPLPRSWCHTIVAEHPESEGEFFEELEMDNLKTRGVVYASVTLNLDWSNERTTPETLVKWLESALDDSVFPCGMAFVWTPKHLIPRVLFGLENHWNARYVENIALIRKTRGNKFFSAPYPVLNMEHQTCLVFRRNPGFELDLRHQRNCDVIFQFRNQEEEDNHARDSASHPPSVPSTELAHIASTLLPPPPDHDLSVPRHLLVGGHPRHAIQGWTVVRTPVWGGGASE